MARELTAKDLNLDDEEVVVDQKIPKTDINPEEDSLDVIFKGDPADGVGKFGKEAFEEEVAEAKARQKKAETDRAAEELEKLEGKKERKEEEETLDAKDKVAAEKAIKEAKKKMHEATTKASKLEKIVVDLQKRVNEASSGAPSAPAENPWNVKRQRVADDTIAKAAAIPAPVAPQDRDDPEFDAKWTEYQKKMGEYNGKVALVWAEAQTEIANLAFEEREEGKKNQEAVIFAVDSALEEVGLITDKTNQKEKDSILKVFWAFSTDVSRSIPLEDQIKETAKLCKDFVDEQRGKERKRAKEEKENQEGLEVLGRGTKGSTIKEPEIPHTMAEAKSSVLERRRLRRNP